MSPTENVASKKLKWTSTTWLLVLGIVFIALTLRSPLTSVGPVIEDIRNSLHISNVVAGFITTIPLLAFAIVSPSYRKYRVELRLNALYSYL